MLIYTISRKYYTVSGGPSYAPIHIKKSLDLTEEIPIDRSWKTGPFKTYNFSSMDELIRGGYLHHILKVWIGLHRTSTNIGFNEMLTDKWVEFSF